MEKQFRNPEAKNKIKQLKVDAHKQIDRNKIILKELINKYNKLDLGPLLLGLWVDHTSTNNSKDKSILREVKLTTIIYKMTELHRHKSKTKLQW